MRTAGRTHGSIKFKAKALWTPRGSHVNVRFLKWRACDSLAVGKVCCEKRRYFSVSQHLRPHQRPWHSGIEISYHSSLHTNGHRLLRLAGARSQSFSLATQQVNINLHAVLVWVRFDTATFFRSQNLKRTFSQGIYERVHMKWKILYGSEHR